ncbi:hypothetical protein L3Q82_025427 [Scortum barcoo]|uniref:Uncharacterized protein n=1 Tax=Scortum barcoo TaxID=214431 RepID=A0ACB8WMD0_9TELE|nr:hypothetical protein L3Q82_025427 [Scortum barcoo]
MGNIGSLLRPLLRTFYETVVASVVSYAVVCWGGVCSERDKKRLNRLIKRASSVCGCPLDSIEVMGERRALAKLSTIIGQHLPPSASDCGGLKQLLQQQTQTPKAPDNDPADGSPEVGGLGVTFLVQPQEDSGGLPRGSTFAVGHLVLVSCGVSPPPSAFRGDPPPSVF